MIFTDQSRQSDEGDCPRKRYWHYHSTNGYGIEKRATNLPTATGIYIHQPITKIYEMLLLGRTKTFNYADPTTRKQIRLAIDQSVKAYAEEVRIAGSFRDNSVEQEDIDFFLREQTTLVAGFTWAYCRVVLPVILKEYEVVAVEHEESLVFGCDCGAGGTKGWEDHSAECSGVVQQARPDLVMRKLQEPWAGRLGLHDLKTHKYVGNSEVNRYKTSVQLAVGTAAVERRLQEPVTHYMIHAFAKGDRKRSYTPETRAFDGRKQQLSPFCYVGWKPASPPVQRKDIVDVGEGSKWYQRSAVWTLKPSDKPKDWTVVEWVVDQLPVVVLEKQLVLIGPYERAGHLIQDHLLAVEHNERRWNQRVWDIYNEVQTGGDFPAALAKQVPATWACYKYGSDYPCQFLDICHKNGVDPNAPMRSGQFVLRRPHHVGEMAAMQASGVELPAGIVVTERVED